MRVLLDEMLPIGLRELLTPYEVVSAAYAGMAGLPNGELLSRAVDLHFHVLVTLDTGIPHQQNVARQDIGIVVIMDNDVDLIRPYAGRVLAAIENVRPGQFLRVGRLAGRVEPDGDS